MALTRRRLIQAAGGAAAGHVLYPVFGRAGEAFGKAPVSPEAARRNRLVVIHLYGGNDGLNTVIPTGGPRYDVYRKVRPAIGYKPSETLPLDLPQDRPHRFGLNRELATVHRLYRAGRVAIVQGVDYPDHSYSHFTSGDIWHSGEPERTPTSGWLGRHLDRSQTGDGELRGIAIGGTLPLMLRGSEHSGLPIQSLAATRFADGTGAVADARHDALALFDHHASSEPLRRHAGIGARQAVDLVDALSRVKPAKSTGNVTADAMLTARTLLGLDLGVECVFLGMGGYDNHTTQRANHERQLGRLDAAIETFFYGTHEGTATGAGALPSSLASRTTVLVMSEFGRRIGDNGAGAAAGTDHGAAAPVLVIGPPGRVGAGLHGSHPPLGTTALAEDNLRMTTDVRSVYRTVLDDWLHDPDPLYARVGKLPKLFR